MGTRDKQKYQGRGKISLNDGTVKSEGALSEILNVLGKSETVQFDQILSSFRLGEGKIYDDTVKLNRPDLKLEVKGWTSLVYDPEKKGNPIKYNVTGASLKQSLGKDVQKFLPFLGGRGSCYTDFISGTCRSRKYP